jgi:hypothetical protein
MPLLDAAKCIWMEESVVEQTSWKHWHWECAVMVGRPVLWRLAVNGQAGVRHVLEILRSELELAMALSGSPTLAHVNRSLVKIM